jgi:raffinose/stachyose/melibiose transport system permease protein
MRVSFSIAIYGGEWADRLVRPREGVVILRSRWLAKYYSSWLIAPALLMFCVFFIVPNLANFFLGFTDWTIFYLYDFKFNGLENFRSLFAEGTFWIALKNTLYFALLTVTAKLAIGFLLATLVCRRTRLNSYLRAVLFLPVMISGIVVGVIFVALYNPQSGVVNGFLRAVGLGGLAKEWLVDARYAMTSICVMEIWQWLGFHMAVFIAGMQAIPEELYEAAKIDGANGAQRMRNITLPLVIPSISVNFVFSLIAGVKVFTQVFSTTNGGPADATQVFGTFLYKTFSDGLLGYSASVGLVMTVIILLLTLLSLPILRRAEVEL